MNATRPDTTIRRPTAPALCALLGALVLGGCGVSDRGETVTTYPVEGKVVLADGSPLTEGAVVFVPAKDAGRQASGKIQPDGTFKLTTQQADDGAAPGDYKVRVEAPAAPKGAPRGTKPKFAPKYNDEDESRLVATIKPEPNTLPPFTLK